MGSVRDIAAVIDSVLRLASSLQKLGNNWYRQSADWDSFPAKVKIMKEKLAFWERETRERGFPSDDAIIRQLKDVKLSLEKEIEARKKGDATNLSRCWSRSSRMIFPAQVGLGMQAVTDLVDSIPATLRLEGEFREAVDKKVKTQPFKEYISADRRYVTLEDSERDICGALEDPDAPSIVLVYGGAGKGKSTLARNLVPRYLDLETRIRKFEFVYFFSRGPEVQAEEILMQIICYLGRSPSVTCTNPQEWRACDRIEIQKDARSLLTSAKGLIVLDDIADEDFLQTIIQSCGPGVKCLVTSREPNLCRSRNDESKYICFPIQELDPEAAKKILASHAGLPEQTFPDHLKDVAEKMIEESARIPLVLASLGSMIDRKRKDDLSEWEEAHVNFLFALHRRPTNAVLQGDYSQSFWAVTKVTMESLSSSARRLLLLVHACEGSTVREEIVQALYKSDKFSLGLGPFSDARSELEDRQLVTIIDDSDLCTQPSHNHRERSKTWLIHSLHRLYLDEQMKDDKHATIRPPLLDTENVPQSHTVGHKDTTLDGKVWKIVCYLYFKWALVKTHMEISVPQFLCPFNFHIRDKVRYALEPVILLLGRVVSDRWTNSASSSVRKVLVAFFYDGALDVESLSYLLGFGSSSHSAWMTFRGIVGGLPPLLEGHISLHDRNKSLIKAIAEKVAHAAGSDLQKEALEVIAHAKPAGKFMNLIFDSIMSKHIEGVNVLDLLVKLLAEVSVDSEIKRICIRALNKLAISCWYEPAAKSATVLVQWPGFLEELVKAMSTDGNASLQMGSVECLSHLSGLHINTSLDDFVKVRILNHPRLLSELLRLLSKHMYTTLDLQVKKGVLSTLISLTKWVDETKVKLIESATAIELLASLLHMTGETRQEITDVHKKALEVVAILAEVKDGSHKTKIRTTKNIVELLVHIIDCDSDDCPATESIQDRSCTYGDYDMQRAAQALILLDPTKARELVLHSPRAYQARASAFRKLGHKTEASVDTFKACELQVEIETLSRGCGRLKLNSNSGGGDGSGGFTRKSGSAVYGSAHLQRDEDENDGDEDDREGRKQWKTDSATEDKKSLLKGKRKHEWKTDSTTEDKEILLKEKRKHESEDRAGHKKIVRGGGGGEGSGSGSGSGSGGGGGGGGGGAWRGVSGAFEFDHYDNCFFNSPLLWGHEIRPGFTPWLQE